MATLDNLSSCTSSTSSSIICLGLTQSVFFSLCCFRSGWFPHFLFRCLRSHLHITLRTQWCHIDGSSQEFLAFTFKLASQQAVSLHSVGSLISGHVISVIGSESKEEVSAVEFVLDTCRQLMDSVLSLWSLHSTLAQAYSSTLLISCPS